MPVLAGPLFSLTASGLFGKCLLYYDTRYGARVRSPKKYFVPPGSIWEVNKEWFKKASIRSKILNKFQKHAWQWAYPQACDTWRDLFMGRQIEAWNLDPSNNITWPDVWVPDIGEIVFAHGQEFPTGIDWWVKEIDTYKKKTYTCAHLFWRVLDSPSAPDEDDIYKETFSYFCDFEFVQGHVNYLWGGVRYLNGTWKAVFLDSYDRT